MVQKMKNLLKIVGAGSTLVVVGQLALAVAPEYYVPFCGIAQ